MKNAIMTAALLLASNNVFAAGSWTDAVIAHSVTTSTLQLLNAVSGNSCRVPAQSDLQPFCLGALPPDLKKPTLVGTGCGFSLRIQCGNGISAVISGQNQVYLVLGPKNTQYDSGGPGIVIHDVKLTGLAN